MSNLKLPPDVLPTESYNEEHLALLGQRPSEISEGAPEGAFLGKNFREDAPFRAKVTPPHERGMVVLIKGRVWGHDTKDPLAHVKIDVWQANAKGIYENENERGGTDSESFVNRVRLYSDRLGYYEFETIHPGPYQVNGPKGLFWRAPHIHFRVRCSEYEPLVTELTFIGDPHIDSDLFLIQSTMIGLEEKVRNNRKYKEGVFDIVLRPKPTQPIDK